MSALFQKKGFAILVLIPLLFFQLIYSFLFPASGFADTWQPIGTYLPKFQTESADNFILDKIYPLISSEYRLVSDSGNYLELAKNFTPEYFEGHVFLERPLYSFLIFSLSLPLRLFGISSYGIIFGLAILLNFTLISLAVLLFFSLLKKLFSLRLAFLSSVLLIFSPYVHASLIQPLPEMLMVFALVLTVCFLYDYFKKPSIPKLIAYSLVIGIFMLAKMFFAISIFILLLAFFFRRHREGVIFLAVHLVPMLFWYLWITQVWQIGYYSSDIQQWNMGVWIFNIFQWPWFQTSRIFISAIPNFIGALIYGFLLLPVFFSALGLQSLPFKSRNLFYFSALFSFFTLAFMMNFYLPHHAFLLFFIIYPTCILGIDRIAARLKAKKPWYSPVFCAIIIGLIIFISNVNIYKIFNYVGFHIRI